MNIDVWNNPVIGIVKILGIEHPVHECTTDLAERRQRGEIHYASGQIRLNYSQPPSQLRITFLHEILHVLDDAMNLGLKEDQIKRISSLIGAVWTENGWTLPDPPRPRTREE